MRVGYLTKPHPIACTAKQRRKSVAAQLAANPATPRGWYRLWRSIAEHWESLEGHDTVSNAGAVPWQGKICPTRRYASLPAFGTRSAVTPQP